MGIREPPSSVEAEKACLGSVMIRPAALDELAELQIDDFFLPMHREIFEAMRAISSRGRALDFVGLADELKVRQVLGRLPEGERYLITLAQDTPTAENVKYYAKTVAEKAALRRLITSCAAIASGAYSEIADVGDYLADARAQLAGIEMGGEDGPVQVTKDIDDVVDDMEKRAQDPDRYVIRTGLRRLDNLITGMEPGTVTVVAANPSKGKTAFVINTVMRVGARGIPCLLFSLEMTRRQIIQRMLAYETRINGRAIQRAELTSDQWYTTGNVQQRWHEVDIPIWVDERVLTAARLCAAARRWKARVRQQRLARGLSKEEAELAVVAIDYLGLVKGEEDSESRRMEVAGMSRSFKQLAKDEKVAVLEAAQLNRANMKDAAKPREPMLSDLRDAGEIEQDGDIILFPWWEGEPPMEGVHPGEIIVRKNRNGPTGHAKVYWDRSIMTFSDPTGDDDDEG
jgi:replicative DNA helicase